MTVTQLGQILKQMYDTAPDKEKATSIHLFGIRYGKQIIAGSISAAEIVKASGLKDSFKTEVRKGVNLSKYVNY